MWCAADISILRWSTWTIVQLNICGAATATPVHLLLHLCHCISIAILFNASTLWYCRSVVWLNVATAAPLHQSFYASTLWCAADKYSAVGLHQGFLCINIPSSCPDHDHTPGQKLMRSDQPYHLHRGIFVQKFTLVLINLDEVEFYILVSLKSLLVSLWWTPYKEWYRPNQTMIKVATGHGWRWRKTLCAIVPPKIFRLDMYTCANHEILRIICI